jgi:hypothetical protein
LNNRDLTYMTNKIYILILATIFSFNLCTAQDTADSLANSDSLKIPPKTRLLVARIQLGHKTEDIRLTKVQAALNFASYLSRLFEIIPAAASDSMSVVLKNENLQPTAKVISERLGADRIVFVNVNRIANMLRVDLSLVNPLSPMQKAQGTGYALIRHRFEKTGELMYDPALLIACQRALASAENDKIMFFFAKDKFKVFPAEPLVVGGLEFVNDPAEKEWKLFGEKERAEFGKDLTQSMFEAAIDAPYYAVYDPETRDSVFAVYNLYLIENCRAPSIVEIDALNKFQVKKYLTGKLIRTPEGATIEISLCDIRGTKLYVIKTESAEFKTDAIDILETIAAELVKKILDIKDSDS